MTRQTLREAVERRLGDTANDIWSDAELNSYAAEAYLLLARRTRIFFALDTLQCTASTGTYALPSDVSQVERVLHDGQKLPNSSGRDLRFTLPLYRTQTGKPFTYTQDDDGPATIRLAYIPDTTGEEYTVSGTWGILRSPADITSETATGTWGVPRRIPYHHPGRGLWGLPRQILSDSDNLRVEGFRAGLSVTQDSDSYELPDQYCRYLQWFVLFRAYDRDGPGQDVQLAQHYQQRWEGALELIALRLAQTRRARAGVFGEGFARGSSTVAPPRLPWAYPRLPTRR